MKNFIAKRVAKELHDGDVVNLGIGIPDLVPQYLPEGVKVILQGELGVISIAQEGHIFSVRILQNSCCQIII